VKCRKEEQGVGRGLGVGEGEGEGGGNFRGGGAAKTGEVEMAWGGKGEKREPTSQKKEGPHGGGKGGLGGWGTPPITNRKIKAQQKQQTL